MKNTIFFEKSQAIKREIEADPKLLNRIKLCFSGDFEPFAKGTENEIYRIGTTESKMHLVLRKKKYSQSLKDDAEHFDIYCQNAETLAQSRVQGNFLYRPQSVGFCIAIRVGDEVGIITEDMSEGGKYELANVMGDYSKRKVGEETIDEVFVDLDSCRPDGYFKSSEVISETPYFASQNMIVID